MTNANEALSDTSGGWLFKIAVRRISAAAAGLIVGALTSGPVVNWLNSAGITLDPSMLKETIVGLVTLGMVGIHDWLRMTKIGKKASL